MFSRLSRPVSALALAGTLASSPLVAETGVPDGAGNLKVFEQLQEVIVGVSSRVKPWVVHIEAVQKRGEQKYKVLGSGLLFDAKGHVVTNHHIIDEAKLITVTLPDGVKLEAELVGSDRQTDLALIKISPVGVALPAPTLGDSTKVSVGEWIIAVGNPYGFDRTVYFGIVSGKGRTLASLNPYQDVDSGFSFTTDFIQTDASIDSGSSGGPLVNLRGEVIGINSMGLGRGISFTIPINTAKDVVEKLVSDGKLARGWVGLSVQPVSRPMASYFHLPGGGVLISEVMEDSPAAEAGFHRGDIIVEMNGEAIRAENEEDLNRFSRMIWSSPVGTRSWVRVHRDRKVLTLAVRIGEQPKLEAREVETAWGFNVKEITQDLFREYLLDSRKGVLVSYVEAGTAAGEARLREGDVIKSVGETTTDTLAAFEKEYGRLNAKAGQVLLLAKRRKDHMYILLELEKYKPKSP